MSRLTAAAITACLVGLTLAMPAGAQQGFRFEHYPTGPHAYDFRQRSPETSLSFMEQRRRERNAAANAAAPLAGLPGAGASGGGTYAVGNWQQFYMYLGDGATGVIDNTSPQTDWGVQTATSNVNSQNAEGDQSITNGSDWEGSFDGQSTIQQGSYCDTCTRPEGDVSWKWNP
ncbi:MAG: hypothetical protein IBX53_04410 [Halomonas sp.]|uniref:hypothetical protein n=1 Tax=Halomonas sp. TaxID=1486246 RepID=UPI0019E09DC7|nr:hypothetical protein [Halomonas sp.]MBE0488298.1 hypothetical protein [Halomonas sp.]